MDNFYIDKMKKYRIVKVVLEEDIIHGSRNSRITKGTILFRVDIFKKILWFSWWDKLLEECWTMSVEDSEKYYEPKYFSDKERAKIWIESIENPKPIKKDEETIIEEIIYF
jgi:hypothetical protein